MIERLRWWRLFFFFLGGGRGGLQGQTISRDIEENVVVEFEVWQSFC